MRDAGHRTAQKAKIIYPPPRGVDIILVNFLKSEVFFQLKFLLIQYMQQYIWTLKQYDKFKIIYLYFIYKNRRAIFILIKEMVSIILQYCEEFVFN